MSQPEGMFPGTGMPDSDWWTALFPDPAGIVDAAGVDAGMHVVDLCCGDGHFTPALAQRAARVTAIDLDPALMAITRSRMEGIDHCEFVVGDAYDLGALLTVRADLVFLANAFHGVPDKVRLSRAVGETLNRDGTFAILNWNARPRDETVLLGEPRGPATAMRMTPQSVVEIVSRAGFVAQPVIDVPPYHYLSRFRISSV